MRSQAQLSLLFLGAMGAALAQPVIRPNSVVNAASYLQAGLPNHGIAQGGMFILKGQGLGARGTVVANSFPLQTSMGGTSMTITVAGGVVKPLMVYVVAGQVSDQFGPFDQLAGIVPSTTPVGTGTITVTYNGQTSAPASITIVRSVFGIFTINQGGTGPGVFTNTNSRVSTLVAPAQPGDLLFIWGTGLGPIQTSDAGAPPVGNLDVPVEVYVGNAKADISYKGRSGCCAGIDQILFTVPSGVQGCFVPVVVKTANIASNSTTLSVAAAGTVCSDPGGFSASELQKAQTGERITIADINLQRFIGTMSLPGIGTVQGAMDQGEGHFRRYQPGSILGSTRGSIAGFAGGRPSVGCVVFPFGAEPDLFDNVGADVSDPVWKKEIDAGPALNITGPAGVRRLPRQGSSDTYFSYSLPDDTPLGGGFPPLIPATPEYLTAGSYTVDNGSGSSDVGPLTASLTIPSSAIAWSNHEALSTISRAQDLTVTWTGGASGLVLIEGSSANPSTQAGAGFQCVAPANAGTFTVPAWVLSALPASAPASDIPAPAGFLMVGTTLNSPSRFQARGVDAGYFNWSVLQIKNVNFQ